MSNASTQVLINNGLLAAGMLISYFAFGESPALGFAAGFLGTTIIGGIVLR